MCEKAQSNLHNSIKEYGCISCFYHLCRDFSLDYVTLTFGSRREGSAPNRELNQTNLCLNLKGADPPVVS